MTLEQMLEFMRWHGSDVNLLWSEDNDLWECAWVTSGRRVLGFSTEPVHAVQMCLKESRITWACFRCRSAGQDIDIGSTGAGEPCCPVCSAVEFEEVKL